MASGELAQIIEHVVAHAEVIGPRRPNARANPAHFLMPDTLDNLDDEEDDDVLEELMKVELNGTRLADEFLNRQHCGKDGLNLLLEVMAVVRRRCKGNHPVPYTM